MPHPRVIVVGGGASGLSAAAALARRRIEALVLEQDHAIGGTWARRYDRLHLHSGTCAAAGGWWIETAAGGWTSPVVVIATGQ